ncbi:MAG: hypothetical protein ACFFGZ_02445 [Candidatus Thorarchaeota archaeon]
MSVNMDDLWIKFGLVYVGCLAIITIGILAVRSLLKNFAESKIGQLIGYEYTEVIFADLWSAISFIIIDLILALILTLLVYLAYYLYIGITRFISAITNAFRI